MNIRRHVRTLIFSLTLMSVSGTAASRPSPTETMTVHGRFLYTAAGERVILRGVNEMFSVSRDPIGAWSMAEISKTGANAVRIFTTPSFSANELDAALNSATTNGMIPIAECHAATGNWEKLGQCVAYWTRLDIATVIRKHRRWVLVNIANEAGKDVAPNEFVLGYQGAITRIRGAGITVPLVIDGFDWGKEYTILLDSWAALNASDPAKSIIVSAHSYWAGTEEERRAPYRTIIQRVEKDNIPFILGEGPTPTGWDCKPSPYRWAMKGLNKAQIGWLAWSWGVVPNGDCRKENSYDITDGGVFGRWKSKAGEPLMISDPASVRNTSRRPCSIHRAGRNCVGRQRRAPRRS